MVPPQRGGGGGLQGDLPNTQKSEGLERERLATACPASSSMFRPAIQMLYLHHTELGVPFSQVQKHKSFMHDWKKWWRGSVMTIFTPLGITACSLGH